MAAHFYDNQGNLLAVDPIWQATDYNEPTTPQNQSGSAGHAAATQMRVGLTTVLDEGWLAFDTIKLTSLSALITARPSQYHKLTAQVNGRLNSANNGRLFIQYSNGTIVNVWQNDGIFNGNQNVNGSFTTPTGVSSFQVGTEVVLDKGYLTFTDVKLTAYSDAIPVTAGDDYHLESQINGSVQAGLGQGGEIKARYYNAAGQDIGADTLWQNPVNFNGVALVDQTFNANTAAATMRLALQVNLDVGYLVFSNFALEHNVTDTSIIQRRTYSLAGQAIAV
ncbi:MAG TPA: hypothetical protein PLK31_19300, partial [Chloroflexota bacterium]|nr:hypothetical protein [Chloroflexota bacterium]